MVRGNICYKCGKEMPYWYIEEGDLTISKEKIVCPFCGWVLKGAMDLHEQDDDTGQKDNNGEKTQ